MHVTRHKPKRPPNPNTVFECEASWNLKSNVWGALLDPPGSGLWPHYPDAWSSDLHFLGGRFFFMHWDDFCSFSSAISCHLGKVGFRYLCTHNRAIVYLQDWAPSGASAEGMIFAVWVW